MSYSEIVSTLSKVAMAVNRSKTTLIHKSNFNMNVFVTGATGLEARRRLLTESQRTAGWIEKSRSQPAIENVP